VNEAPRPFYESEKDRSNERDVIRVAEAAWSAKAIKLKKAYHVDYMLESSDGRKAFAEIKCRNYSLHGLNRLGGLFISLHKWVMARQMTEVCRVPLLVLLKTTDGYWYHATEDFKHDGLSFGGRTDRNDWQDTEPVITLRSHRFTKLR
jgi:hypothetical protein